MTGLKAAEQLFVQSGLSRLQRDFPDYVDRMAVGLVGEGSECFGFDDSLSRDHDWSPGFCIWLEADDYADAGARIHQAYKGLVHKKTGYTATGEMGERSRRRGVFATADFYSRFIHRETPPESLSDWLKLPEEYLAVCTNGRVFHDPLGAFSEFRRRLLEFYPEDIRLKKVAARCVTLAQDGQYNFPRSLKRGDVVAANHALARFIHAACSLVFLLLRRYKPFYKWMHRGLLDLEDPGPEVASLLERMCRPPGETVTARNEDRLSAVEETAVILAGALNKMDVSHSSSSFLLKHAAVVQDRIENREIQGLPLGMG